MNAEFDAYIKDIVHRQHLPRWAMWLALDEDGSLWLYQAEPHRFDRGWYENEVGQSQRIARLTPQQEWHACLWKIDDLLAQL